MYICLHLRIYVYIYEIYTKVLDNSFLDWTSQLSLDNKRHRETMYILSISNDVSDNPLAHASGESAPLA